MSSIEEAFQKIDRADFVPPEQKQNAHLDIPLPIGYGQTISQPTTVRLMLEWLKPKIGNAVLDVGSGSGWSTALLATIVGETGTVHAVERIPELVAFGRSNCRKYKLENAIFHEAGASYGLPEKSPFDRILVSASAEQLPSELIDQLNYDGRLIVPVRSDILQITKSRDGSIHTEVHPGFMFVPLI